MKRRQILNNWYWLLSLGGSREMGVAHAPVSKNSTPSEVSEYARRLAVESLGLAPIASPNEPERCEQTDHSERRSPNVE